MKILWYLFNQITLNLYLFVVFKVDDNSLLSTVNVKHSVDPVFRLMRFPLDGELDFLFWKIDFID